MKHKHLTIMFTDIKGFTDKTSRSSREQLQRTIDLHEKLISPAFKQFNGTVIKTIGDAFMVAFESPTDAVLCGMRVQKILADYNRPVEADEKIEVRIAINSGEVVLKGNDVYGEAVNIASRLESIAEANDIYFTESVYLSMNKSEIPTAEIGYRHFKGIPHEIKVYKVLREKKGSKTFKPGIFNYKESKTKKILILATTAVLILIISIIVLKSIIPDQPASKLTQEQKERLIDETKQQIKEVETAIQSNNQRAALDGIKNLERRSEKLGRPELLTNEITRLKQIYSKKFKEQI